MKSFSREHFRRALSRRKRWAQNYDEAKGLTYHSYARIVARVYQNPNIGERETAQRLLGWIACSRRSLKWHEIQGAVSIDVKDNVVDFESRQLCTHIKDICGSLVDIIPGDRVQLVHGTAKSYVNVLFNSNI
jgi:hypothetical protein